MVPVGTGGSDVTPDPLCHLPPRVKRDPPELEDPRVPRAPAENPGPPARPALLEPL